MINKKIVSFLEKILKNKLFLVLLIIPFVKPATELTGKYDIIFDALKVFSFSFSIISYLLIYKKPSNIILTLTIFQFIFILSTIINSGDIWWICVQAASIVGLAILFEMTLKIDKKNALFTFSVVLLSMSLLTCLSMFVYFPKGMYIVTSGKLTEHNNFLWGFDNSSVFKIIPSMIISGIYVYRYCTNKIMIVYVYMIIALAFIYVESMTAASILVLLIILYTILIFSKNAKKILDIKYIFPFILTIFLMILLFNSKLDFIQDFALKLKKGYSINSRFLMWNKSLKYIFTKPILGYGYEVKSILKKKFVYDHVHNLFLDIFYRGGIVAFIAYSLNLVTIIKNNCKVKTICYNIFSIGLACILLCGIMDYYNDQYLMFILFIVGFYAKYIESKFNSHKELKEE